MSFPHPLVLRRGVFFGVELIAHQKERICWGLNDDTMYYDWKVHPNKKFRSDYPKCKGTSLCGPESGRMDLLSIREKRKSKKKNRKAVLSELEKRIPQTISKNKNAFEGHTPEETHAESPVHAPEVHPNVPPPDDTSSPKSLGSAGTFKSKRLTTGKSVSGGVETSSYPESEEEIDEIPLSRRRRSGVESSAPQTERPPMMSPSLPILEGSINKGKGKVGKHPASWMADEFRLPSNSDRLRELGVEISRSAPPLTGLRLSDLHIASYLGLGAISRAADVDALQNL